LNNEIASKYNKMPSGIEIEIIIIITTKEEYFGAQESRSTPYSIFTQISDLLPLPCGLAPLLNHRIIIISISTHKSRDFNLTLIESKQANAAEEKRRDREMREKMVRDLAEQQERERLKVEKKRQDMADLKLKLDEQVSYRRSATTKQ